MESRDEEGAREPEHSDAAAADAFWRRLATLTDEDLLTFEEAAMMARMEPDSLRYIVYHRKGGPKGFRLGKKRVFRKGEVRKWIDAVEASQAGAA